MCYFFQSTLWSVSLLRATHRQIDRKTDRKTKRDGCAWMPCSPDPCVKRWELRGRGKGRPTFLSSLLVMLLQEQVTWALGQKGQAHQLDQGGDDDHSKQIRPGALLKAKKGGWWMMRSFFGGSWTHGPGSFCFLHRAPLTQDKPQE